MFSLRDYTLQTYLRVPVGSAVQVLVRVYRSLPVVRWPYLQPGNLNLDRQKQPKVVRTKF